MSAVFKATLKCDMCHVTRTVVLTGKIIVKLNLYTQLEWWLRKLHWLHDVDNGKYYCAECSDGCPGRKREEADPLSYNFR